MKSFIGHGIKNDNHEKTTSKSAKWFNKDICRLIRAKNRLYRRATTFGKSYHGEVHCAARNKATYAIRVAKAKFYNQKAETLANPNCPLSKWWQLAKELCDLNGRNSTTIPPLRTCAQDTVKNDQEKANLLNHTFINQNTCLNLEGFPIGPTQWGLFIKMATDWQVSEVGDTCRAAAGPGRRRSVQIELLSAGTAHLGFPALLSVPHLLSREIKMNRRHWNLCLPSRIFAQLMSEKSSSLYQTKRLLVLMRFRIAFLKKLVLER